MSYESRIDLLDRLSYKLTAAEHTGNLTECQEVADAARAIPGRAAARLYLAARAARDAIRARRILAAAVRRY